VKILNQTSIGEYATIGGRQAHTGALCGGGSAGESGEGSGNKGCPSAISGSS